MRVLYLSKALVVAAYRGKLAALSRGAEVLAVVPSRWGRQPVEPVGNDGGTIELRRCILHGHNHLHVYPALGAVLDAFKPDLVHIDEEPYSAVTLQAARLCERRGIPCLFFAWQNLSKSIPPPFGVLRRRVFQSVSGAIAGTPAAARVLQENGFDRAFTVIPQFGVDPASFRPDPGRNAVTRVRSEWPDDEFVIGFGGRFVWEKGIHLLIRAAAQIPGARVSIVGHGPERAKLVELAAALDMAERVDFGGALPSTQMPGWLRTLDVLVLPSLTAPTWAEQFGRILIEAMACGVPVIASRSGEIPHVVGDAGILVDEDDVDALRTALEALAANAPLRHRLVRAGIDRVSQRFTHERIADDTLDFYRRILAGGAA